MQSLRNSLKERGFSTEVTNVLLQSWSEGTQKQYEPYIKSWINFCSEREINPFDPSINSVLDFLNELNKKGLAYTTINTARSAISAFVLPHGTLAIGSNPIVSRFMKGVFKSNPPAPRYQTTWDVQPVLTYLASFEPARILSLKLLTLKTVMLVSLVTAQRRQSLHMLDINFMSQTSDALEFVLSEHIKQSRPGYEPPSLILKPFAQDLRLCVFEHMKAYLTQTERLRGSATKLFISFSKPFKPVSRDTISRWIRTVMKDAGINVSVFKPHSTRAAAISKAKAGAVPIQEILKTAGWSSERTFNRFYNKPVHSNGFASAVLSTTQ